MLTIGQAAEHWKPQVLNSEYNGRPAYATSDLLMRHPTRPGFWKLFGRKDDQIMLSTGEKVCLRSSSPSHTELRHVYRPIRGH